MLPADGYTRLSFKECSLGAERPLGYDPLLGQGRDAQDPFYEAIKDEGDIGVPLDVRALGFWLRGLLGTPVSADNGDGTFSHAFTSGLDLPSLAMEIGHTKLTTPKFFRHGGAKLDKMTFDMARSGAANATRLGDRPGGSRSRRRHRRHPGQLPAQAVQPGQRHHPGRWRPTGQRGGRQAVLFQQFGAGRDHPRRRPDRRRGRDRSHLRGFSGRPLRHRHHADRRHRRRKPAAVGIRLHHPGLGLRPDLPSPRVFLPKKKQEIKGPGGIQASYDWRAARDPVAGYLLRVTLVNDVAGY